MIISRARCAALTLALVLALDLGRSLYARVGSAQPTRLWHADASDARAIAWPPGRDLRPDASPGERVYAQHCAVCHGPEGRGNGPAAPSLHPRPRDFSGGVFKLKSTPSGQPPTRADVGQSISHGMPGSSMPAWDDLLSAEDIDAVADTVRGFGPLAHWAPEESRVPAAVLAAASAQRGHDLYGDLGCPTCHGPSGRGDGQSAKDLKDVWKQPDPPRDLSVPWTFRGGDRAEALYARVANGMSGTPMPGYDEVATPQQIADVVAYVRSLARAPFWETGEAAARADLADPIKRGEYLVHAGMCGLCHTPVDADGIYLADTHYLAGGMKVQAGAHGVFFSRNLTPDPETGLGGWSAEQIAVAVRTGHTPQRRLSYWGMPWMALGALTADDALAVAAYLKTLPPVRNQVPLPLHYGVVETVLRKLAYPWPTAAPERLAYFAGNFGYEQPTRWSREVPQTLLIWAQVLVIALGGLVFVGARAPVEGARLGAALISVVAIVVVACVVFVVYRYPALQTLPAQPIIDGFVGTIPAVQGEGRPAAQTRVLERGRYLYSIASCAYCHNGNGAGGLKVNWEVLGTTWTRNLTAHASGLAAWSDAAVLRAMISGVSRDGRPLHWQAMIWDHVSNYSVEDQRALLAYLRSLPPVDDALPAALPPGATDCPGDTFWIGATNAKAGCE